MKPTGLDPLDHARAIVYAVLLREVVENRAPIANPTPLRGLDRPWAAATLLGAILLSLILGGWFLSIQ